VRGTNRANIELIDVTDNQKRIAVKIILYVHTYVCEGSNQSNHYLNKVEERMSNSLYELTLNIRQNQQ
jgi:hypothetical protein